MRFRIGLLGVLALCMSLGAAPARAQGQPGLLRGGRATPNFFGVTGLLYSPSAYTVGSRGVAGHLHAHQDFWSGGALVGPTDRLELGATYVDFDDEFCDDDGVLLNGKFNLLKEGRVLPAVSVGVVDALDQLNMDPGWYFVLSKDLKRTIPLLGVSARVHFGFGDGVYNLEPFGGFEIDFGNFTDVTPLTRVRTSFMAEFVNGNPNLGLRAKWRGFGITLGVFDFDRVGGGISYTTGLRL